MAAGTSQQLRLPSLTAARASSFSTPATKVSFPLNSNYSPSFSTKPNSTIVCARSSKDVRFRPGDPDPVYKNRLVGMLVNRIMKSGKKSLAYNILYLALKRIRTKMATAGGDTNPLLVLRDALREVTPDVMVKSRRVGGATHQVPTEVSAGQGKALAIRWLLKAARKRSGKDMVLRLSDEIMDAAKKTGEAVKTKEATHKTAEANRAFAHFR